MLRTFVASSTTLAMLAAGCASERPWPASPVTVSTRAFATDRAVTTIDVLPFDLQLWTEPGYEGDVDELRASSENAAMRVALETLAARQYRTGAMINWNGDFPGGNALPQDALLATVGALARYGAAAARHPGQLPVPHLPARLGMATGADATLYLGGWAYVAKHRDSAGMQIAKGLGLVLLAVTVVALVVVATRSSKSRDGRAHEHRGRGGGGAGDSPAPRGRTLSASRGVRHVHRAPRVGAAMADAFGHVAIEVALASPDWGADPALPQDGGESQMYLEATLVDNRTGLALWHARQRFPANAASDDDTARVTRMMFDRLPGRGTAPLAAAR